MIADGKRESSEYVLSVRLDYDDEEEEEEKGEEEKKGEEEEEEEDNHIYLCTDRISNPEFLVKNL